MSIKRRIGIFTILVMAEFASLAVPVGRYRIEMTEQRPFGPDGPSEQEVGEHIRFLRSIIQTTSVPYRGYVQEALRVVEMFIKNPSQNNALYAKSMVEMALSLTTLNSLRGKLGVLLEMLNNYLGTPTPEPEIAPAIIPSTPEAATVLQWWERPVPEAPQWPLPPEGRFDFDMERPAPPPLFPLLPEVVPAMEYEQYAPVPYAPDAPVPGEEQVDMEFLRHMGYEDAPDTPVIGVGDTLAPDRQLGME